MNNLYSKIIQNNLYSFVEGRFAHFQQLIVFFFVVQEVILPPFLKKHPQPFYEQIKLLIFFQGFYKVHSMVDKFYWFLVICSPVLISI